MIFLNRVELFKELSLNELREYDVSTAEKLIGDYYDAFSTFCDFLQRNNNVADEKGIIHPIVDSVSCSIDNSGVHFEIKMANGQSQEVFMSREREKQFKEERLKELVTK